MKITTGDNNISVRIAPGGRRPRSIPDDVFAPDESPNLPSATRGGHQADAERCGEDFLETRELSDEDAPEVLRFLSERPLHTVAMTDLVRGCGLSSPALRGSFWGCRDERGRLLGVSLIGHSTLFEARSEAAIRAFARLARQCSNRHLLMGEREKVRRFWNYCATDGEHPRLKRRVKLLERHETVTCCLPVPDLRPATVAELQAVISTQAQMVREESGVDPLAADPIGFRARCLQRIHKGREWVLVRNGELIFKAAVIAETPEVAYVEGLYVTPAERRKGYAERCLAHMTNLLLRSTRMVSLFVEETNTSAERVYRRAGYRHCSDYGILYF